MYVVWGTGNYGRCDEVPGLCHVVTRCGHLYYLPIIPMEGYAVIEEQGDQFRAASVPIGGKSLLLTWGRAILIVGLFVGVLMTCLGVMDLQREGPWTLITWGTPTLLGAALLIASYRMQFFRRASRRRALELGKLLGLDEQGLATINEIYDTLETPSPDDDIAYDTGFSVEDPRFQTMDK